MHEQLKDYLSQIEKQLAELPSEQREEELREIRSHLEMMIEENISRGGDVDEAVAKALEQFGGASKVGKALECTHESSPHRKSKMKIKLVVYCALIYSTNFIMYLLTSSGFIAPSPEFTSRYSNFTFIIVMLVCGWMHESTNHKKIDLYFIKTLPLFFLYVISLLIIAHFQTFPFLPFIMLPLMAAGARAYRWYAGDRKLFNWR